MPHVHNIDGPLILFGGPLKYTYLECPASGRTQFYKIHPCGRCIGYGRINSI